MSGQRRIKLRAVDGDDLQVVSACLQDALVPLREVAFLKKEARFVMVANRFRWELGGEPAKPDGERSEPADAPTADAQREDAQGEDAQGEDARFEDDGSAPPFERTNCGVCFDRVERVRFRGIDPGSKHQILNLLAIESEPGSIDLLFSDDAAIRLDVSAVSCHLEDLGEPWPTRWHPDHDLDGEAERG